MSAADDIHTDRPELDAADDARLADAIAAATAELAAACERAGRAPDEVTIVAAAKYGGPRLCGSLVKHGIRALGVNRVAHLNAVASRMPPHFAGEWHMIGHLQRNKVKALDVPLTALHSLDSAKLARELVKRDATPARVLVQVNVAGETQKDGVAPEAVEDLLRRLRDDHGVVATGLMTMAPAVEDAEQTRPVFRALRELRDRLRDGGAEGLNELSMGMSQDFAVAVEEGATMVRLGRTLVAGLVGLDNDRQE